MCFKNFLCIINHKWTGIVNPSSWIRTNSISFHGSMIEIESKGERGGRYYYVIFGEQVCQRCGRAKKMQCEMIGNKVTDRAFKWKLRNYQKYPLYWEDTRIIHDD